MKVAVVFRHLRPHILHKDPALLVSGLRAIGHDARMICPNDSSGGAPFPVQTASDGEVERADFWRAQGLDAALVYTWMGGARKTVDALVEAGVQVVSKGDTDGQIGVPVHRWETFKRMVIPQDGLFDRLRAAWFWLKKYFWYHLEEERILATMDRAAATIVEMASAREALGKFLRYYQREDLLNKIHVIRNPISETVLDAPIPEKRRLVVAIARWEEPGKDCHLMIKTLDRFLTGRTDTDVLVMGSGAPDWWNPLRKHPNFRYLGVVAHEVVRDHLGRAQVCVVSSRWEGCMLAVHEAVAMGATIAGPTIPVFSSIVGEGPFGTLSRSRHPAAVALALEAELDAWRKGERDPAAIAAYWRPKLHPTEIARQVAALMV
ncbi:MAG: glycosyltransferase family 4 protein [Armatimonadetes bacterium]|nr:glycosyltransferase family 4 protein [Armatimonadota bacterium]